MENQILEISTALMHDIPDTQVIKVGYGTPFCGCWLSWAVTHFEAPYLDETADILSRGVCRHPLYQGVLVDPLDGTEVDSSQTEKARSTMEEVKRMASACKKLLLRPLTEKQGCLC